MGGLMQHRSDRSRNLTAAKSRIVRTLFALLLSLAPVAVLHSFGESLDKPHRKVLVKVDPEYPEFLRTGRYEGYVVLEATVLPNGTVSNVGIKRGNPMLAQYATKAVQKWKYAPGPNQTVEEVSFHFKPGSSVND